MKAFDNFCTIVNRNEYSTKQLQTVSLQPNYVSTLPGKTKNSTKTVNRLLQWVLLNRLFQTFAESRSMLISFPICLKILLAVFWQKIFYILLGFYKKNIFKLNMLDISM